MAQATSPSMPLSAGQNQSHPSSESNKDPPIDPSIAASSPTYPGPYSPYPPQGHEMGQYPGHPPPGYPHWPGSYPGHPHGMPYSSPGAPSAGGSPATTGPPRPGQVKSPALRIVTVAFTYASRTGLLIRPDSRCSTAQASSTSL